LKEFKCDIRNSGNILYGKKQSLFAGLCRLYNSYVKNWKAIKVLGDER
jgi:hypothetical protein